MNKLGLLIFTATLFCFPVAFALPEDDQSDLRINPGIEENITLPEIDYSSYSFLRLPENKIELNGAEWTGAKELYKMAKAGDTIFSVLYLGDSHIQADFGGAVLREHLAADAGGAGRGFITPFKLAATNQPLDYTFRLNSEYIASRLLKMPWATDMTFSGIGIQPLQQEYTLEISCQTPFDRCRLFYKGRAPEIKSITTASDTLTFAVDKISKGVISFSLPETVEEMALTLNGKTIISGLELAYNSAGTFVHSIGNNGATYSTYGMIDDFGPAVASLAPDLILIALGTNEAFSNITSDAMIGNIDNLVSTVRQYNPAAAIVLITPTECFKKKTVRRKSKGRIRKVSVTVVNDKAAEMRNDILNYAKTHSIPVYDTFSIVGGKGSAAKMKNANVLGKDGIHFTADGYRLQGSLLAEAVIEALSDKN